MIMPIDRFRFVKCFAALALLLAACTATAPSEPMGDAVGTTVFVTSNGWHTGIVIAKADMTPNLLPETGDFPDAVFFEFGWGDAKFYPAEETTIGMTMEAALVPSPAVMHMVGLWTTPSRYFPDAEVVKLSIDATQFSRLMTFIDDSFDRAGNPRVSASAPGLYKSSGFYPAKGSFHLLNTCNTWTARALRAAGLEIKATGTTHAEALMQQVRGLDQAA
jgi:uncharacterized protein (TIGR02117 family)